MPPNTDPLVIALIGAIKPLIKHSQPDVMAATAEFELTLSQLRMLFVLDHAGGDLAVNALAEQVGLSMPAAGRAVDALVRGGLLSRREDSLDRRIKRIGLTALGQRTIEQISMARRRSTEQFVRSLEPAEREALAHASETLARLTRKYFPAAGMPTPPSPSSDPDA